MRATARGSKTSRRVQTIVQATHLPHRAHPSSSSPPRRAHSRAARSRASRARHKPRLLRVARSPSPERSLRRRRSPRRRGTRSRRRRSSLTTCRGRTRLRSHARVLRLEGVSFVRASPVRPWRMTHARARSPYLSWPIVCSCFVGGNRAWLRWMAHSDSIGSVWSGTGKQSELPKYLANSKFRRDSDRVHAHRCSLRSSAQLLLAQGASSYRHNRPKRTPPKKPDEVQVGIFFEVLARSLVPVHFRQASAHGSLRNR